MAMKAKRQLYIHVEYWVLSMSLQRRVHFWNAKIWSKFEITLGQKTHVTIPFLRASSYGLLVAPPPPPLTRYLSPEPEDYLRFRRGDRPGLTWGLINNTQAAGLARARKARGLVRLKHGPFARCFPRNDEQWASWLCAGFISNIFPPLPPAWSVFSAAMWMKEKLKV